MGPRFRGDDGRHSRDGISPEVRHFVCASLKRGRGESRVRAAPEVSCARRVKNKTHTSIQVQRKHSGLPRAMVYGLYALSLVACCATIAGVMGKHHR
jgi:hypothetical protein